MDRAWLSGSSGSPPSAPGSPSIGYPTAGSPGVTPATVPGPYWYHMITEELRNILTSASVTPDQAVLTQLKTALDTLYVNESQFTGSNQSLASPGYQKLPGGIILQWGSFTSSATPGNAVAVTLPVAFTTAMYTLLVAPSLNAGTTVSAWAESGTTTGFNGRCSVASTAVNWFAVGR